MGKYLRHFGFDTTPAVSRAVATASGCVVNQLDFAFPRKFFGNGVSKVHFVLDDSVSHPAEPQLRIDVLVCPVRIELESDAAFEDARRVVGEAILGRLLALAPEWDWDVQALERFREVLRAKDYSFGGEWLAGKADPSRRWRASLAFEFRQEIQLDLTVCAADGSSAKKVHIATLGPGIWGLLSVANRLCWHDGETVRVMWEDRRNYWEYRLAGSEVRFHFGRAEGGDAHGQYDLAMMYLSGEVIGKDPERYRYWLERAAEQGFSRAVRARARLEA